MGPLSLSRKSLVGRLMLAFFLLGFLLLLLISLGSLSLYWVKQADKFLYDKALPASQVARELVQSSNALAENAQSLGTVEEEAKRQFIGRMLSINSTNLLGSIAKLKALGVQNDHRLEWSAGEIIHELSALGQGVGKRLKVAGELSDLGASLVISSSLSTELLEAELAVVDSAIIAKLSLAYPELAGNDSSALLLDEVIEQDLDIQERLNRALKLIHNIALIGQLLQSPDQEGALVTLLNAMSQQPSIGLPANYQIQSAISTDPNSASLNNAGPQIDMMPLELLKGLIRDPARAAELSKEFIVLRQVSAGLSMQTEYVNLIKGQGEQLRHLSDKLAGLNRSLDSAMATQQAQAELARVDYLRQLFWAKTGLWGTGVLMLLVILSVMYVVIYRGIALRLNEASEALSRLSLGDTNVTINSHGDDELTAMANAISAFKDKTAHNQKLQSELRTSASELTEHKAALEITVESRTQELAVANKRLDAEAKGHAQARNMAEEASQAKSLFLATMSHEIRTPLNGLLGTLTLLGHSELPAAQKQMLALSQYSGTLLQTVLNDILDFSRLEQGKLTNEPRAVAINDLLDEVVSIMLAGAGLAGLRLVLESPKLPTWLSVDGPKLRQVLFNLIGNAIKFTPQGEVKLKVCINDNQLNFEVSDTGVGISHAAKQQLFKAYSSLPNQGRSRGTGLGLAISKELVELMNQSANPYAEVSSDSLASQSSLLWVTSEVNRGSCFGFSVPLIECQQANEQQNKQLDHVAKKCVLVIEDNKVNAMVAQGFLAHLGHESVLAGSCEQARKIYHAKSTSEFDAIMLDIQLGDGSGFELLNELKAINHHAAHSLPIAAFTAQLQSDDLHHYQQVGFDIVLGKPLNMQALAEWVGLAETTEQTLTASTESVASKEGASERAGIVEAELSLLDLAQLDQDIEYLGKETVLEMMSLFRQSSDSHIAQLELLSNDVDNPVIQDSKGLSDSSKSLLHALKGSSASMGLSALSSLCKTLENAAYQTKEHQALAQMLFRSVNALECYLDKVSEGP